MRNKLPSMTDSQLNLARVIIARRPSNEEKLRELLHKLNICLELVKRRSEPAPTEDSQPSWH